MVLSNSISLQVALVSLTPAVRHIPLLPQETQNKPAELDAIFLFCEVKKTQRSFQTELVLNHVL